MALSPVCFKKAYFDFSTWVHFPLIRRFHYVCSNSNCSHSFVKKASVIDFESKTIALEALGCVGSRYSCFKKGKQTGSQCRVKAMSRKCFFKCAEF
jgi:hypothetical protein